MKRARQHHDLFSGLQVAFISSGFTPNRLVALKGVIERNGGSTETIQSGGLIRTLSGNSPLKRLATHRGLLAHQRPHDAGSGAPHKPPSMYIVGGASSAPVALDSSVLEQLAKVGREIPMLSADWISDSVKEGNRLPLEHYQVEIITKDEAVKSAAEQARQEEEQRQKEQMQHEMPAHTCERFTPFSSPNDDLVGVFLELERYYEAIGDPGHRALSYRRAAAALKWWPDRIHAGLEVRHVAAIGARMEENIDEILETGHLQRLEAMKQDPMAQALVTLCSIHGVGPGTALEWYQQGITSVEEAQRRFLGAHDSKTGLTDEQIMGLQYYDDLQHPLTRQDCDGIAQLVREILVDIGRDIDREGQLRFEICGSYRRQKPTCGDIDILVAFRTSAGESAHAELLEPLRDRLSARGILENLQLRVGAHFRKEELSKFRVSAEFHEPHRIFLGLIFWAGYYRRIDIVVVPWSQWAFAILGWSGTRLFVRDMRRFAHEQRQVHLSQTCMVDESTGLLLCRCETEEEIFAALGMAYIPPEGRHC